ncbi:MAG: short-chain dehydrogenase [Bradyrhizobium sp.]|nr:short-chain dehydrogenase [Bradyrhizobium sp.]
MLRFDDKVAVITGAAQGVGRAYARAFAARGAKVVINDLACDADGLLLADRTATEIRAAGGEAIASGDSVATAEGGERIVATALDTWGRADILIHNAGILRDATFAKLTAEQLESVMAVHLLGAFHVGQPAFRWMRDNGGGRILLTSSASGLFGNFGQSNYAAAKLGMVGLVRVLAMEGAKYGINANAISPYAATQLTGGSQDEEALLSPANIAPTALVLCHQDCASNGEIFQTAAGWTGRVTIDLTEGYALQDRKSPEELLAHWEEVRSGPKHELPAARALVEILTAKLGVDSLQ